MRDTAACDIAIIGGGLAGLTLALQLNQHSPGLSVVVLERTKLPAPAAAHKVGEAMVEIGAHYLAHTLSLETLLEGCAASDKLFPVAGLSMHRHARHS